MFLTPPDISLPTTKPPCPLNTVQLSIITFSVARLRFLPSSSFPDFIQIPSSPTSKVLLTIIAFLQDSRSSPSPFCAYDGFLTCTPSKITFSHINGWIFHAGEFWKITPCRKTFLHSIKLTITGRRKSLTDCHSSAVCK